MEAPCCRSLRLPINSKAAAGAATYSAQPGPKPAKTGRPGPPLANPTSFQFLVLELQRHCLERLSLASLLAGRLQIFDRTIKGIREAPSKALVGDLAHQSGDSPAAAFSESRCIHHNAAIGCSMPMGLKITVTLLGIDGLSATVSPCTGISMQLDRWLEMESLTVPCTPY